LSSSAGSITDGEALLKHGVTSLLCELGQTHEKQQHHILERLFSGATEQLTQPGLKADLEAAEHHLAHGLIADGSSLGTPDEGVQHLNNTHKGDTIRRLIGAHEAGMCHGIGNALHNVSKIWRCGICGWMDV